MWSNRMRNCHCPRYQFPWINTSIVCANKNQVIGQLCNNKQEHQSTMNRKRIRIESVKLLTAGLSPQWKTGNDKLQMWLRLQTGDVVSCALFIWYAHCSLKMLNHVNSHNHMLRPDDRRCNSRDELPASQSRNWDERPTWIVTWIVSETLIQCIAVKSRLEVFWCLWWLVSKSMGCEWICPV